MSSNEFQQNLPDKRRSPSNRGSALFTAGGWRIEVIMFAGMIGIYQFSRSLAVGDATEAFANAFSVINIEKAVGIFYEPQLQQAVVENLHLTQALNLIYVWAHLPVTIAFFVWLYTKRRHAYTFVRNGFFLANIVALGVFVLFPVAPPRMLHDEGFVDTLSLFSGIDLHDGQFSSFLNPFAAVPSMHMGYALMVGVVIALLVRSWTMRILALMYPLLILFTIVATANHYVLDALAGGLVMAVAFAAVYGLHRWYENRDLATART